MFPSCDRSHSFRRPAQPILASDTCEKCKDADLRHWQSSAGPVMTRICVIGTESVKMTATSKDLLKGA